MSPLGRALVDKRVSARTGPDSGRLPVERRSYRSSTELALEMLERALQPQTVWVAGDDAFGMSPSFREAALGTCWTFRRHYGLALRVGLDQCRAPPQAQAEGWAARPWSSAVILRGLAGDNGGPGVPRAAHLYVQRPAGAGYQ